MKLSEQMKREFEAAVAIRVQEMLLEQVEAVASDQVKAILSGHGRVKKAKTFKIEHPSTAVLRRGDKAALGKLLPGRLCSDITRAAWEALARDGKFANKAVRSDMTAYLMGSFAERGATPSRVSAALSNAIKIGLLTAEA